MSSVQKKQRKFGFDDPIVLGYERTFKNSRQKDTTITRDDFCDYLNYLRYEMRKCLDKSEKARDTYYAYRDAFADERGLTGFELDEALKVKREAQAAISDNQMYDRWAQKYASVLQAEAAYATFVGWGRSTE